MKKVLLILTLCISSLAVSAQNYYLMGDSCYMAGDFKKSVEYFNMFLSELESGGQNRSFDYAKILVCISDSYLGMQDFESAAMSCRNAEDIIREQKQTESGFYLKCLLNSAAANGALGENDNTIAYFEKALPLIETLQGKNSQVYADVCRNLAFLYFNKRQGERSIGFLKDAAEIYLRIAGENSDSYIETMSELSQAYYEAGDMDNTMLYTQKYAGLAKSRYGADSKEYVHAVRNLGVGYMNLANYNKALELLSEAAEIYRKTEGGTGAEYAKTINNISQIYMRTGDLYNGLKYTKEYCAIAGKRHGENSPAYAEVLVSLASVCCDLGDYSGARDAGLKAEKILVANNLQKSEHYFSCISTLSNAFSQLQDEKSAFEYNNKLVSVFEDGSAEGGEMFASQLRNLGVKYSNVANFSRAIECFNRALEVYKKTSGEKSEKYVNTLIDVSNTYLLMHDFDKAKETIVRAYKLSFAAGQNQETYTCANVLTQLAEICLKLNSTDEALNYNLKALPILEKTAGATSLKYLQTMTSVGKAYQHKKDYAAATEYLTKAYETAKTGVNNKVFTANITNSLASVYYESQDYAPAYKYFFEAYSVYESELKNKFSFMTAKERETYWNFFSVVFDNLLTIAITVQNESAVAEAYNSLLISKGLLLASELQLTNVIMNSGNNALIEKFNALKDLRQQISTLSESSQDNEKLKSLSSEAAEIESEIVKASSQYGDIINYIKVDWKQVQNALNPGDVAIEFFYTQKTFGALVLKKEFSSPKLVMLEDMEIDYPYNTQDLYNTVWKPLEQYFSPEGKVYFSPSGKLHTLAIEYAPVDRKSIISDKYKIYRISSTRNLALKSGHQGAVSAVLFGGVAYDTNPEKMKEESGKYAGLTRSSKRSSLFNGLEAAYLEGTLTEVQNIRQFMETTSIGTEIHTGSEATEECFKSLSGRDITIIHIATHGFYLDNNDLGDNVLNYSGLLFSGCNNAKTPDGIEDGILTAREISYLDLRKTDLVVLSACETGLGKVSSEGVFGLQRGFKKTGVNTMIMSLWRVDDAATQMLMSEFYKNLSSGMSKHDAFIASQKNLRSQKGMKAQHWAAFIMLDGDK